MNQYWNLSLDELAAILIRSHPNQQPLQLAAIPNNNFSIYENGSLKKYIYQIAFSKKTLSTLLAKKNFFFKFLSQNCSLKKIIFKIAPCNKTFKNFFSPKYIIRKIFSKLLPHKLLSQKTHFISQKLHYQNCLHKKYIFKIALSKNIILIFSFNLFSNRIIRRTLSVINNMYNHDFSIY